MEVDKLRCLEGVLALTCVATVYSVLTTSTVVCVGVLCVAWCVYKRERKRATPAVPLTGKHVLITGCDSGIGFALAKTLHALGGHVIATVLNPDGKGAKELRDVPCARMKVLPLDVGSDDSVSQCLKRVRELCGEKGLWGLVNNAGINFIGDVELTTMRQYLHIANVNVFGMVRTTRAFLPLLRQAQGRIVNITSIKGQLSTPLNAAYNIAKYGGETFSEITRLEMAKFGVKVTVIEPGNFGGATGCLNPEAIKRIGNDFDEMWQNASEDAKKVYSKQHLDSVLAGAEATADSTYPTLTPVMDAITEALTSTDPDPRYIIDGSNSLVDKFCMLARVKPFIPAKLFDRLVLYFFPYSIQQGQ